MEMGYRLRYHCPPQFEVLAAPFRVVLDDGTEARPDLVVVRRTEYAPDGLHGAPLLVVDVRCAGSPAPPDERSAFERAGTPFYWVLEAAETPERASVEIWALGVGGRYTRVVRITGVYTYFTTAPYRVPICPADLVP
jgi:hypothetical protein